MATTFEDLVDNMVNIGIGVAATAAEKSREMLDTLGAKGAEARADARNTDFARSMADIFEQAGGAFGNVTEQISMKGTGLAERVLDELILARARALSATEREEFLAHVQDLVDSVDGETVTVEVEVDEAADDADDGADAPAGQ